MAGKKSRNPAGSRDDPRDPPRPEPFPELPPILQGPFDFSESEEEDDEEDLDSDEPRSVLITGAAGNIGQKLIAAWKDQYQLILIDSIESPKHDIIVADLSIRDEEWTSYFEEVDVVVHLAANPNEFASWEELENPNLDVLSNVFLASALGGVDRIVFASSNHVMGGYRELGDMPITVDLPARPGNAYGASKLMGERLGMAIAEAFGMSFVALRLGWCQRGINRPDALPDDWSRSLWISNSDMVRLFECAVEAELGDTPSVVLNGLSNNRGTRWDLSKTAEILGFIPEDDAYALEL